MNSTLEITNLLYRYAEAIDRGQLESLEGIFANTQFKLFGLEGLRPAAEAISMLKGVVEMYPDGTPRTKHVVSNPIIEIDEAKGTASCRSYYTVLQSTDALPLQIIASGRYHDEFKLISGRWEFTFRDLSLFDFAGNVSGHLNGF